MNLYGPKQLADSIRSGRRNTDYLVEKEEHVTTMEALDFGQFLRDSALQEKRLRSKSTLIKLLRDSGES